MNIKEFLEHKPPYICAPITGRSSDEIKDQLKVIVGEKPDLIEWRADFYNDLSNENKVLTTIKSITDTTNIPLLFTIRSEVEGGEKSSLNEEEKVALICSVCKKSAVTFVDYEAFHDKEFINRIREVTMDNDKLLILSYHNFKETPDNHELLERLKRAVLLKADIAKLAVMPRDKEDVFRLLEVTRKADQAIHIPVVTMSMGDIGRISRMVGWIYGSKITFGSGVHSSAPGQIPLHKLRQYINQTKRLTGESE
ncbi:type I 3-dehydroquinate dehydratase [Virgibacillus sp. W0181]|uniref:type I 3-dehydroquinate dehydratase n=1 Tax=Virgibacillus sp. W0181 TaxID=3391581 RepID=UPI003F483128